MIPGINSKPWRDESELALVRDWFYPDRMVRDPYSAVDNTDMRSEAIASVNVWTFRSHAVPAAVTSTADLNDSIINYEALQKSGDLDRYRSVQFMFAFAFLRFVNGFVDRDIAKSTSTTLMLDDDEPEDDNVIRVYGESSMYAHALAIGMPERFVDLRHQVSHGQIPDLHVLKKAADEALVWLWERWWKSNATEKAAITARRFNAESIV